MRALLLLAALALAGIAAAQLRPIPDDAQRGQIRHVGELVVEIDGRRVELAPGAQIRDADNRIILPVALPPGAAVKYRIDGNGQVRQVWLLSAEEAAR